MSQMFDVIKKSCMLELTHYHNIGLQNTLNKPFCCNLKFFTKVNIARWHGTD